ncbi:MAG: hypothetical protein J6T54_03345 [Fibrobacter sp.]|nr:hypothetical protein [Fibrobacter sp.]
MNIVKENLSGFAAKRAYTAPTMEVVVMGHQMDLLECSTCEQPSDDNPPESMGVEEE